MESQPNTIQPVSATPHVDNRPAPNTETLPGVVEKVDTDNKPLTLMATPHLVGDLDMGKFFDENIDNSKTKIDVIDAWIKAEVLFKKWEPTLGSYKDVLKELKSKTGTHKNMSNKTQLDRLFFAIKAKMP